MLFLRRRPGLWLACLLSAPVAMLLAGCASPGAPRPPSLQLPETARNLIAVRTGDLVQVRFAVPTRTTDGQALRGKRVQGQLCRQELPADPCMVVDVEQTAAALQVPSHGGTSAEIAWTDTLSAPLRDGPVRALAYRVTLKNEAGKDAGPSDAFYVAAGAAPPQVSDVRVRGSRQGVLLQWAPDVSRSEILIERTETDSRPAQPGAPARPGPLSAKNALEAGPERRERGASRSPAAEPGATWLTVPPDVAQRGQALDGTVKEDVTYQYVIVRRVTAKVGGRILELRSTPSSPVSLAWRDVYPPSVPEQLTGIGYVLDDTSPGTPATYAVDLVWQPVQDARLTGYLVTRQALTRAGAADGAPQMLTKTPVTTPSFHDATADEHTAYRYGVSSTDARGNTSSATTVDVAPPSR